MTKLTLWGLERYLDSKGDSVINHLSFPDGISKATAVQSIMMRCGECPLLYTDADFFIRAVGYWNDKMYPVWTDWLRAYQQQKEFDPLDNYDKRSESTRENTGDVINTFTGKLNTANTNETTGENANTTVLNGTDNTDNKISAYNSETMRNDTNSANTSHSDSTGSSQNHLVSSGSSQNDTLNNAKRTDDLKETYNERTHGNVGVTKTTDIWREYNSTVVELNIYNAIADLFFSEFCIAVY